MNSPKPKRFSPPPPHLSSVTLEGDIETPEKQTYIDFVRKNLDYINQQLAKRGVTYALVRKKIYDDYGIDINLSTLAKYTQDFNREAKNAAKKTEYNVLNFPGKSTGVSK